jgi:hypothetical protein
MREPPPIYGNTAHGWTDGQNESDNRDQNRFSFWAFLLAVVIGLSALGYPVIASHSKTVVNWDCPSSEALAKRVEPLERTLIKQSVGRFPSFRYRTVEVDCRSFSPKADKEQSQRVIASNRLNFIFFALGALGLSIALRFRLTSDRHGTTL